MTKSFSSPRFGLITIYPLEATGDYFPVEINSTAGPMVLDLPSEAYREQFIADFQLLNAESAAAVAGYIGNDPYEKEAH